mgnify:CR=1 FL=1
MPHIDLVTCQLCYGSRRIITATNGDDGIAGTIKPCSCGSGVEAVTDDGEVVPVGGSGKLSHHAEPMDR